MPAPRLFDHDEARRRVRAGETIVAVARDMGVSHTAVWRIMTPERLKRDYARARAYYRAVCEACGGPCVSARHPSKNKHNTDGRELCHRCRSDEKIERLRFDPVTNELTAVQCSSLNCANGERWQDPDRFTRGNRHHDIREGGIHGECRSCQTRRRTKWRHEHADADRAADRAYRRRRRAA